MLDRTNRALLATVLVLGAALVWTIFVARRTTRPILALQQHTQRVAGGDLDARIEVNTKDDAVVQKLQREVQHLKEILNMKRRGGALDIHQQLLQLKMENSRLSK